MAILKNQIESHLPFTLTSTQTSQAISYLTEIQRILLYLVAEDDLIVFRTKQNVDPNGLDIKLMRSIEAFKDGYRAPLYPQHTFDLLSDNQYSGIYKPSSKAPASVIKDGKLYIFPGGGHAMAAGIVPVTDLETEQAVGNMPLPFQSASVYYTAIQFLKELLETANESKESVGNEPTITLNPTFPTLSREAFAEAISMALHPNAPAAPTLSADQATAPNVTAPTITSPGISRDAEYTPQNPSLDYTEVDARQLNDDIEMVNGAIMKLQKKIDEATLNIQDELNRARQWTVEYESTIQHSLEQGRLTASATNSQQQLKLQQELENAQNKLRAAIEEKQLLFTKYQQEVSSIVASNQNLIAEFRANVEVWARKNDLNVAEFTTKTNQILSKYQTDVQAEFEKHTAQVRKVSTNTNVSDSKIQGYIQSISILTNQFTQAVQSYLSSVEMRNVKYTPAPVSAGDG